MNYKYIILIVCFLSAFATINAQPNYATKQIIENVVVVQDAKKKSLYYYEPGDLVLQYSKTKSPKFQFLDLR